MIIGDVGGRVELRGEGLSLVVSIGISSMLRFCHLLSKFFATSYQRGVTSCEGSSLVGESEGHWQLPLYIYLSLIVGGALVIVGR